MVEFFGPMPIEEPIFWFFIILFQIIFLLTAIFYKFLGKLLRNYIVWFYKLFDKLKVPIPANLHYSKWETKEALKVSQMLILIISLVLLAFFLLVLVTAILRII